MGYVEETGAAQLLRDVRITTIYEGTTGIQANDLVGRKIAREGGATIKALLGTMRGLDRELAAQADADSAAIRSALQRGVDAVEAAVDHIVAHYGGATKSVSVGAVPFLKLFGAVAGGWQLARAAIAARRQLAEGRGDAGFLHAKIVTARFYADHVLAQAPGLAHTVIHGARGALALAEDEF